jgi:hypothetical protein
MNSKQRIGLAIGGGIIAVAAAVGVGAFAANLATSGGGQPGSAGGGGYGQSGGFGRGGQQFDTTTMATQLAAKLGVDEAKVKTALDNALKASQPSGGPSGGFTPGARPSGGMPSGAMPSGGTPGGGDDRRTERLTAMAKSIASELNLDEAKVLAALQEVMTSSGAGQASGRPSAQATK